MLNKETVEKYFVKAPLHDSQGRICPLPPKEKTKADRLKKDWLKEKLPDGVTPLFSIGPAKQNDGTEGYWIRKDVVFSKSKLIYH